MFVRWKKRKRPARYSGPLTEGKYYLSAVLVESKRVGGKVQQKIVRYLGAVDEVLAGQPEGAEVELFWLTVDRNLTSLGLDLDTRATIEAKIAERIPRLPKPVVPTNGLG